MPTQKRVGVAVYEGFFGLLALGALLLENVMRIVRGTYDSGDLWNYFTYQSNLIAAIALLASSYESGKGKNSRAVEILRGAATLYMVITGVVFALLVHNASPAVWFDNNIMHQVMPVALFVAWLIHQPAERIPLTRALKWLWYPLAYAAYASAYGKVTGTYFYSFLDPTDGGYGPVLITIGVLVVFGACVAWVLVCAVPWVLDRIGPRPRTPLRMA